MQYPSFLLAKAKATWRLSKFPARFSFLLLLSYDCALFFPKLVIHQHLVLFLLHFIVQRLLGEASTHSTLVSCSIKTSVNALSLRYLYFNILPFYSDITSDVVSVWVSAP